MGKRLTVKVDHQPRARMETWRSRSPGRIGVPHHHVGVGARDDTTFARVKVVDLGSIRAGYSHKTILVHFSCNL